MVASSTSTSLRHRKADPHNETESESSLSLNSSSNDLSDANKQQAPNRSESLSLEERAVVPWSMYIIYGTIAAVQYSCNFYSRETWESWSSSMRTSASTFASLCGSSVRLLFGITDVNNEGDDDRTHAYVKTAVVSLLVSFLLYIFVVAPMRAGFWTGKRTRHHKLHRYAGLLYLAQYACVWIEYFTDYESASSSFLPHCIALNGIIQGTSAYFSFKVLPALTDAGYYSDKAVLSRNFVHENLFFTLLAVFGSVYYYPAHRAALQSTIPGRIVEFVFIFYAYVLIRPTFPITRFSSAGTTRKGRTAPNHRFYEIGTLMVKLFYLWAKYFLGFFVNFLVYMDLVNDDDEWRVIRGVFLLNLGTVSLAVFLHTLRFRKVLPAKLTFSIYLVQIYLTFLGIPMVLKMFGAHPNLCLLCTAGILCNMTRNRYIHAAWCTAAMLLLKTRNDIKW